MAQQKYNRTVYILFISNMIFCGLLFFEYMIKFDYINYKDQSSLTEIQLVNQQHIISIDSIDDNDENDDIIIDDMINWSIEPYSICYINNKNKNISNIDRIALVTVSDLTSYPHPSSWYPLARMNRLQYAYKFSYDYCDFPRDWDFTTLRETRWVKFGALYTILKYYKYIVWLDTDTLFFNKPHIPFQKYVMQWFKNYTNLSVLFSNHAKHSENINAGIIVIKNSKFSFNFLEKCYANYVNKDITANHADQDAFQDFMDKYNGNNEIMIIPAGNLQTIYVQANPQKVEDDYKKLYKKQGRSIIFHRIGGGKKKYFQMNDVVRDWTDNDILNKMKNKCPDCFIDHENWHDAVRKVDMSDFEEKPGNQMTLYNSSLTSIRKGGKKKKNKNKTS